MNDREVRERAAAAQTRHEMDGYEGRTITNVLPHGDSDAAHLALVEENQRLWRHICDLQAAIDQLRAHSVEVTVVINEMKGYQRVHSILAPGALPRPIYQFNQLPPQTTLVRNLAESVETVWPTQS